MNKDIERLANEITALQRGFTSYSDEKAIVDKVLRTRGLALTELKLLLDSGDDHRDLLELLQSDIDNDVLRDELVHHFETASPTWAELGQPLVKVLSDVDDTLYASLHDQRFPRGTLYPGILELHQALHRSSGRKSTSVNSLTLLTARPRDAAGLVERLTQHQLRRKGLPSVTVLSGSFFALRSHGAMAQKKLENFALYQRIFPEFDFVFIGDNGQGDLSLGEMMLARYPSRMHSVFIHDVTNTTPENLAEGLRTFSSYLEMAIDLHQHGLLTLEDCKQVEIGTVRDLHKTQFHSKSQSDSAFEVLRVQQTRLRALYQKVA